MACHSLFIMQPSWKVVNVVSSASVGNRFVMKALSNKLQTCQYNPRKFHAIILPIKNRAKILIFESGKVVCVGAKSQEESISCIHLAVDKLNGLGYSCCLSNFALKNIVISGTFGKQVLLLPLKQTCDNTLWEPELFPGLTYWMKQPVKATALVFCSGKFIITGLKHLSDLPTAFTHLETVVAPYLKSI